MDVGKKRGFGGQDKNRVRGVNGEDRQGILRRMANGPGEGGGGGDGVHMAAWVQGTIGEMGYLWEIIVRESERKKLGSVGHTYRKGVGI